MANLNSPTISNELVDLVETMRQAQIHYDQMVDDREGEFTQHQVRRAKQVRDVEQQKVDKYLLRYRAELKKYAQAFEPKETNELPALYDVERDR